MKEGAILIVRDSEDRILIAKRGELCNGYAGHWEFPGETCNSSDGNLRETASRGSWEELRMCIRPHEWQLVGQYISDRWLGRVYQTTIGNRIPQIAEPGYCQELQFVSFDQICSYDPLTPDTRVVLGILETVTQVAA